MFKDQNNDEENKEPIPILASVNELKPLNTSEREMIPLDKHKLEVEQRVREMFILIIRNKFCFRNILKIFYDIVIENYNN